jgi:hypothetical protein
MERLVPPMNPPPMSQPNRGAALMALLVCQKESEND